VFVCISLHTRQQIREYIHVDEIKCVESCKLRTYLLAKRLIKETPIQPVPHVIPEIICEGLKSTDGSCHEVTCQVHQCGQKFRICHK
jgi:hypothetical protein